MEASIYFHLLISTSMEGSSASIACTSIAVGVGFMGVDGSTVDGSGWNFHLQKQIVWKIPVRVACYSIYYRTAVLRHGAHVTNIKIDRTSCNLTPATAAPGSTPIGNFIAASTFTAIRYMYVGCLAWRRARTCLLITKSCRCCDWSNSRNYSSGVCWTFRVTSRTHVRAC